MTTLTTTPDAPAPEQQDNSLTAKLKKLLRLGQQGSGGTQAEMESALETAQRLAVKYNIDLSQIDLTDSSVLEPIIEEELRTCKGKFRRPPCNKFVVNILIQFFNVEAVYMKGGSTIVFFGRKQDVEFAIYLYGYLKNTFTKLWRKYKQEYGVPMSSRASYFFGLFAGLQDKLSKAKDEAEKEQIALGMDSQRYALAVVNEEERRQAAVNNAHPILRKCRTKFTANVNDNHAVNHGVAKGRTIQINPALKEKS